MFYLALISSDTIKLSSAMKYKNFSNLFYYKNCLSATFNHTVIKIFFSSVNDEKDYNLSKSLGICQKSEGPTPEQQNSEICQAQCSCGGSQMYWCPHLLKLLDIFIHKVCCLQSSRVVLTYLASLSLVCIPIKTEVAGNRS